MATGGNNQNLSLTIGANMDPSGVLNAIKTIQNGFNGLKIDPKLMSGLTKEFSEVQKLVKDYQKIMGKENISKADLKNLQKLEGSINSSFSRIIELQNQINGKNIVLKVDATQLDELHKKTEAARQALNDAFGKVNIGNSTGGLTQIENALEKAVGRSKTLKASFNEAFESLNKGEVSQFGSKLDNIFSNLATKVKAGKLIPTVDNLLDSFKQLGLININVNTNSAAEKLLALKDGIQALKTGIATGLNGDELKGLVKNLEDAAKAEKDFESAAIKRGQDNLSKRVGDTERLAAATRDAAKAQTEFQQATLSAQDQVKQLQQSTQYFFSLRNMINLLKQGIREAVDTVKELDAAMTETAVVTDFSVGDMWKKLPEYTANANALGASVKDMYKATTLYYQQGLNTEQAMGIAAETMKMARIGGLEAADATDKMTAALRGFNMELSEVSAQRVNDVYSNLAAKTASDTEELGTAMQRTASIAASAGMSFEGTAAFLAQAIETTREPAENLGTAMKTIVARFQELKKNPLEMTEVDGEEVDYNKVDTALKSIGVSLKDTNGQFRDLDKVFLDISQRWDSLSQTQQRYIATTAAGSRQQSRFIAMMSNYERTMQLMDFANDSAGASTAQFNKTLESLEAKLNKFQNAWKQFLMGIMNDSWTKGIVDAGTTVLNVVNKLINALSLGGKAKGIKSALSVFTAFTALKMAGRGINGLIGGLGGFLDPKSTFGSGFKRGMSQGAAATAAGRITTPILAKLDQLIAAVKGGKGLSQQNKISTVADYNKAASAFQRVGIDKSLTMGQTGDLFKDLSSAYATAAFNSGSGTVSAMKRTSKDWFSNIASQVGLDARSQKIGQQLMSGIYKGMKKGEISPSKGIKLLGKPEKWGEAFGTPVAQEFSKNFLKQLTAQRKTINQELFNKAKRTAFTQMGGLAFATSADIDAYYANPARTKEEVQAYKKAQREIFKRLRQENIAQNNGLSMVPVQTQTDLEQLGTKVSQVGQQFTSAGFSMQMFGQQLSALSPALSGVGNAITMVGTAVSTLGMGMTALGGLPSAIAKIVEGLGGLTVALPALIAVGAAIGAIAYDAIKVQKIKSAAQTVVDSFKEINESTSENIANLESWESEFANLSKGIDKNGNNIDLNTDEYDRYKEIVNSIAEINPSIVKGYNAQGDAIIDNNKALSETLELQKQIRKAATVKYTSNTSLNKLIKARDENEDLFVTKKGDKYSKSKEAFSALRGQLKGQINFDMLTEQLGFDITTATEETIGRNYEQIAKAISSLLSDEAADEVWQALDDFTEAEKAKYEATEDIYKALSIYAEDQRYTTMVPEVLKKQYQLGLKNQALTAKSAQQAKNFAKESAKKLQALGGENSEVGQILAGIKKAQEDYDKDLNESAYLEAIDKNNNGFISQLEAIRDKFEESTDAQEKAYAEMITSMIEEAERYTSTAGAELTHAFNTSKDAINAMSSAYDEFSKALEGGSVEKATDSLKKIYDEMTSGTNSLYGGNKTYWLGAKNFVSDEVFARGNFKEVNGIIKELIPALEDTEAGYQAAGYYIADIAKDIANSTDTSIQELSKYLAPTANGGFEISEAIPTEAIERIAQFRGIDSDILRTLLTKVSRIASFKMWDFEEAKKGYYGDERVIQAEGKNGEEGKVYIKQGEFENDLLSADVMPSDWKEARKEAKKVGIELLPDSLINEKTQKLSKTAKEAIDNLQLDKSNYMSELDRLGYGEEDILAYGHSLNPEKSQEDLQAEYQQMILDKQDPIMSDITTGIDQLNSTLDSIYSVIAGGNLEKGKATDKDFKGQELRDSVFGKEGIDDTPVDFLNKGLTPGGAEISGDNFKDAQEEAKKIVSDTMDYLHSTRQGLEYAKHFGDADLIEKYTKDAEKAEEAYNYAVEGLNTLNRTWGEKSNDDRLARTTTGPETLYELQYGNNPLMNNVIVNGLRQIFSLFNPKYSDWIQPGNYSNEKNKEDNGVKAANSSGEITHIISDLVAKGYGDAISNLDPAQIAQDSNATEALKNIYKDILKDTTPKAEDLATLNLDSLEPTTSFFQNIGAKLKTLQDTFAGADKAALAMDAIPANDNISKAITNLGQRLKNWLDKINGVNPEDSNTPTPEPTEPTPQPSVSTQTPTYDIDTSSAENKVQGLQEKVDETSEKIEQDHHFGISVESSGLRKASKDAAKISKASSKTNVIKTEAATPDLKKVDDARKKIESKTSKIPVGVKDQTSSGMASIRSSLNLSTVYIPVAASAVPGSLTVKLTKAAKGMNNLISYPSLPSFGSLAKGTKSKYGQVGPQNKGGLTLTGEKGFEIAWIPDENRSMILGAHGPQMLNLPSNAVVWTHEQSKKILKQKAIPAGSHAETTPGSWTPDGTVGDEDGARKKKKNKNKGKDDKQQKKNADEAAKVIKKIGNVNAWWWNMGKKVEATQRLIDKTFKKIEKLTNTVGTSLASISEEGDFYIKKLNKQISLNTTMMDKAQKQLNTLDKGAGSKKKKSVKAAQTKVDRAEAKVKKAQKNHDKKAEKQAKKELKKAKKNLRKKQNTANYSTISYDVTVQKKDKKGKVTKTKKNKKQRMDLSPYVKLDEETGAYVVDYKKINSKNWDKSKKKAVMEAAEKKAETYQKRRDTAEDNIEKAQEALDELGKNLYETFLSWEIELTRIWNISQKIAESEARRERAESFSELLEVQLGNGVERILNVDGSINQEYLDKITNTFEKGVQEQVNTITLTQKSIGIKANELYKSLSTTGEQTTLGNVQKLVENAKFTNDFLADAEKELDKASTAAQQVVNAKEDKAEAKEDKKEAKDEKKKAGKTKTKKDDKKAQEKINEAKAAIEAADKIITEQSKIAAEAQTAAEDYQKQAEFYIQQNNGRTYTDTEILAYEREIKELEDQIKIKNAALEFTDVTPNTDGTVTIDFHTEEFEKARQEGRFTAADAEKIQAYVQKLVDDSKDIQETYKTLTEQLTTLNTTLTELQEAWVGYADDLLSYLEEEQSKDITKLKTLSDSIKDSLSKLLDQVKKTLQERRNQEDNAKTEQDILRKQQRLAALRANTSGGNQVEIAQLERELNEAQTSYGRTLEDQLLDRLSNQADEAAEQREKQIKIQEGIRDTVNNAATVNKWMSNPAMFKDSIRQAFFSAQDWENMPLAKQEAIEKSFQTFYAGLLTNQKKQTTIADAIQTTSSMVEFIEGSLGGNVGKDITDDTANTNSLDATVREIAADINSNINKSQNVITETVTNTATETNTHTDEQLGKQDATNAYNSEKLVVINDQKLSKTELNSMLNLGNKAEMTELSVMQDLANTDAFTWTDVIQAFVDLRGKKTAAETLRGYFGDNPSDSRKKGWEKVFGKKYPKYISGGLADYTGPAWLDGTPSKPELVLNATDTKNFLALRDVLSKAIGSANSVTNSYGGDATYEININVDHLNNDYDVDRVAERVKKIIVKDSSYRNVTQVRNFR